MRGNRPVNAKFSQYSARLHLSVISAAEVKSWLYRPATPDRYVAGYLALERDLVLLSVDVAVAEAAGRIAAAVTASGFSIGTPDALIAATAVVHDLTLVTHNTRDFARVESLRLADWMTP